MGFRDKINKKKKSIVKKDLNTDSAIGITIEDVENERYIYIKLDKIEDNPYQPRKEYNEELLNELAQSIKINGLLQPIIVSPHLDKPNFFIIVYGHRRIRAVKINKEQKIKAIVRHISQSDIQIQALIENIQREDLSIFEEALAYKALQDTGLTITQMSKNIGKSRTVVSKTLSVLNLPSKIIDEIKTKNLKTSYNFITELSTIDKDKIMDIWNSLDKENLTIKSLKEKKKKRGGVLISTPPLIRDKKYDFKVINYSQKANKYTINFTKKQLKNEKNTIIKELEYLIKKLQEE
ncbi:MAG TPA: ParB/RepB/Spo0J family partition protein [Campylobacterales bacterium]|nr:ParB/RepB/Spo0J family partition protein [Campylobacterales bacterium]